MVVAACKDDCSKELSDIVKGWFENMGSKNIGKLKFKQGFVFISIKKS